MLARIVTIALFLHGAVLAQENIILAGGGGGRKIVEMDPYQRPRGDFRFEASFYSSLDFDSNIETLRKGEYFGLEISRYSLRPYFGWSEMLLGFNIKRIPLVYFGASAGPFLDLSEYKSYYIDGGVEVGFWAATLLGALQVSERFMVQEHYQTRIDYLFKFPAIGEPPRPRQKAKEK